MSDCTAPGCDGPPVVQGKFNVWCEDHATILERVRNGRVRKATKLTKWNKAERAKLEKKTALKIAQLAVEEPGRSDVAEQVGLGFGSEAFQESLALARSNGWIVVHDHVLVSPGPEPVALTTPKPVASPEPPKPDVPRQNALEFARFVHGSYVDRPVSRADVAAHVGVLPTSLNSRAKFARDAGWLTVKHGAGGGYVPAGELPSL